MDEKKKLPHTASVEELLEAIEKSEPSKVSVEQPTFGNDIVSFLSFYQIEPGIEPVTHRMLFHLYKLWSKEPVSKATFGKQVSMYIGATANSVYHINRPTLKLTEEAFKLVNEQTVDKAKSKPWREHYESFLGYYRITPGRTYIEGSALYNLYDKYTYETKKKKPLGYTQFIRITKLYFKDYKATETKGTMFPIDFPIELGNEILQGITKHNEKTTKTTNKTK